MSQSLAQQFAVEYAKGVVPAALKALKIVKRNTKRIAMLALAVSTPHQALFLFGLGHPHGALNIISSGFFALLIPLTIDLGIITSLAVTQTVGIVKKAQRRALIVLAILVAASATVNVVADGPVLVRGLTAFAAVVLALVEWMAAAISPDFTELEQVETAVAPTAQVDEAEQAARSERATRAAATRAANRQAEADRKAAAAERRRVARQVAELEQMAAGFVPADAPTSPAPGEAAAYL